MQNISFCCIDKYTLRNQNLQNQRQHTYIVRIMILHINCDPSGPDSVVPTVRVKLFHVCRTNLVYWHDALRLYLNRNEGLFQNHKRQMRKLFKAEENRSRLHAKNKAHASRTRWYEMYFYIQTKRTQVFLKPTRSLLALPRNQPYDL